MDVLEDWRARIAPDSTGVLHHTRMLGLLNIHTLKGFEEHVHAFTRAKHARIIGPCGSFSSPSATDFLPPMGSSLIRLELCLLETTSHVITLFWLDSPSRRASPVGPLKRQTTLAGQTQPPKSRSSRATYDTIALLRWGPTRTTRSDSTLHTTWQFGDSHYSGSCKLTVFQLLEVARYLIFTLS